jgi:IS4 transposase
MRHQNSLLHEILKLVPWAAFERSVEKHEADRSVRTLSTKSQLVALLHGQLSGAASLREIVTTMESHQCRLYHLGAAAPKRSTLADANALRPTAVFAELFQSLLAQAHRGLRKASSDAVRLIDASRITLNSLSRDWAHYDATCDGVKMHIVYDPRAALPVHFAVSPARENDLVQAKSVPIEPGATYVFDLGYYSFPWWGQLDAAGCRFVSRLRKNSPTEIVEERVVLKDGAIVRDMIVRVRDRLHNTRKHPFKGRDLREIHVVIETGKTLRLVTNDLTSPAEVIADLYQERWEIELFFRWIKQTLKIKKFLGTSENAVRIQIAVALIAYLLLRMAHAAQKVVASLLAFARLVRANLMHFKSIHDLRAQPPPRVSNPGQLEMPLA